MRVKTLRQLKLLRILIFITAIIVVINESAIFFRRLVFWNQIKCETDQCVRVLLVADPQILGDSFDTNWYYPFANYDSDRHLTMAYGNALGHSRPDIVCFLGDLMDEGSVANYQEYQNYMKRFKKIFQTASTVQTIYISGDNDIGGEIPSIVTEDNVNRFKKEFNEIDFIDVKNRIRFFNVNLLIPKYPNVTGKNTPSSYTRVVLTHMSVLSFPGLATKRVTQEYQPHIIFSAHNHISRIISYPPMKFNDYVETSSILKFNLTQNDTKIPDEKYLEIMVPTCSYRMGVSNFGFGMAVFDKNQLHYTVLWLPNRFHQLIFYGVWLLVCLLAVGMRFAINALKYCCCTTTKSRRTNVKYKIMTSMDSNDSC